MEIQEILPIGESRAIHQKELAARLGVTPSSLKKSVRAARKRGIPIMSGSSGYWLAESDREVERFLQLMESQAVTRFLSIKEIKAKMKMIDGQKRLPVDF